MSQTHSSTRPKSTTKESAPTADRRLWKWGAGAAAVGTLLAGTALLNGRRTKRAQSDNPPLGKFVTVDGVRLHYVERGEGRPIVLLHGNGTMIEDWIVSGVLDELARNHRVIAFDRPGFGHSERPRARVWTPSAQAGLFATAFARLEVEKPIVVGHSFGTQVTVALALDHPRKVAGIVLIGGYYYPSLRADVLVASQPAIPLVGDVMRHTVSPLIGSAMTPMINSRIFAPAPVPGRWEKEFPMEMTLRPSQIRASAADAALMIPAAATLSRRYAELDLPVTIIAGRGDEIVTMKKQSERLHAALPHSRFLPIDDAGHMVHHSAKDEVVGAIAAARQD